MLDNFNTNITLMKKGLKGLWKRNEIIANNISNADSAGYKAKDINFEEVLTREIADTKREDFMGMDLDKPYSNPEFTLMEKEGLEIKSNGNNVDIDKEMVSLAENQMRYNLVSEALKQQLNLLNQVIEETKG